MTQTSFFNKDNTGKNEAKTIKGFILVDTDNTETTVETILKSNLDLVIIWPEANSKKACYMSYCQPTNKHLVHAKTDSLQIAIDMIIKNPDLNEREIYILSPSSANESVIQDIKNQHPELKVISDINELVKPQSRPQPK